MRQGKLSAIVLASIGLLAASAPSIRSHTLYPEDLVVTYTINDLTGDVMYRETGALAQGILCPGTWLSVNQTSSATPQAGHKYQISVSLRLGRYVIEESQNLVLSRVERRCAVPPSIVPLPTDSECRNMSVRWQPTHSYSSPLQVPDGWHDREGPGLQTATGAFQSIAQDQDLRYNAIRVNFTSATPPGSVPFTGRLHFREPATWNDMYWMDQLGGRCMPGPVTNISPYGDGYGTPDDCCEYVPSLHAVNFEAANTGFGARPIGTWRLDLQVCNGGC